MILRLAEGFIDPEEAQEIQYQVWETFKRARRPLNVLIDITVTKDAHLKAKKTLSETIREDAPQVIKTAVLYTDLMAKARTKIVYLMGQRKNIKYFTDEGKALDWLRSI